ncbi:MAG: branched-chain amino acid ABC transporter permease [candidate division WOR-3 bacterium]
MFLQQIINGVTVGSVYALIALGYTLVYGIMELINFAHGEIYMIGAYLAIIFLTNFTLHLPALIIFLLIFLFSIFYTSTYGFTMERIAYRPIRSAPRLSALITALGMSIFLQNFVMVTQGAQDKVFPPNFVNSLNRQLNAVVKIFITEHNLTTEGIIIGNSQITFIQILIVLTSIFLMIFLSLFIGKTKTGKAMRATAQNRAIAMLLGINVDTIISITFIIGSALGAAAGVMIAFYYGRVHYFIGYIAGIKAFTAAVLGGIGNITGAMLGGLMLGLVESMAAGYLSCEYKDAYAFIILVIVLIIRPQGILGERVPEKY